MVVVKIQRQNRLTGLNQAWTIMLVLAALTIGGVGVARADDRPFAFVEQATTTPPGEIEYEQWITWHASTPNDARFSRFDFRHEIEIGLIDHLQLAIYVADWSSQQGPTVEHPGTHYDDSAIELKLNLANPTTDPIGLALYGEYKGGPDVHELEGKLILQKNLTPFVLAYNLSVEAEWERGKGTDGFQSAGIISQSAGISYQVAPWFTVGGELLHEVEFSGWNNREEHAVYLGPNAAYRSKNWWVIITPLLQVTRAGNYPDFQTRLIFGIDF